jgi:8-oxo-dGTP pyrophosphatase MutT (NUDIX family)
LRPVDPPGVLYYPCTSDRALRILEDGGLRRGRRWLTFSPDEESAKQAALRLIGGKPKILYIDAKSAFRCGVDFFRTRSGLYLAEELSLQFVLNADPRFSFQKAAGGAVIKGSGNDAEVALILPAKRNRDMWELPKGKLDFKETFEEAALREIREELGLHAELNLGELLGSIRYSFRTPQGEPRLKIVRFYYVKAEAIERGFEPPPKEVRIAKWFTMSDAIRAIAHDEIRPILRRAFELAHLK